MVAKIQDRLQFCGCNLKWFHKKVNMRRTNHDVRLRGPNGKLYTKPQDLKRIVTCYF